MMHSGSYFAERGNCLYVSRAASSDLECFFGKVMSFSSAYDDRPLLAKLSALREL